MPALQIKTEPVNEPVSLQEAKDHLRVDIDADNSYIQGLIQTARMMAEEITRRALITQTWRLLLDDFPLGDTIELPMPPLQSVTSLTYTDKDGSESTFAVANYEVDTDKEPGEIVLAYGGSWPGDTLQVTSPIEIEYVAGYGDQGTSVPEPVRQAILLIVGDLYENREDAGRQRIYPLPRGAKALLWPYRVMGF